MNTSAIMSQFTSLMAGIGTIPSHVEAGRIVYVDSMEESDLLDPLIDTDPMVIAKSTESQTRARLVEMASQFSKGEAPERDFESLKLKSHFFSEVDRFDNFMSASLDRPFSEVMQMSFEEGAMELPVRDTLARYYDDPTPSYKKTLYKQASEFRSLARALLATRRGAICGKSVIEAASEDRAAGDQMAKALFASAVLFSALGDFENSRTMAEHSFWHASLNFSHPFDRAIASEAAILMNESFKTHYTNAAKNWLRVAKDMPFVDPLGVKIALFRGLRIAAVLPNSTYNGDFLKLSIALGGMEMAFADMAEDYMRLAKWTIRERLNDEDMAKKRHLIRSVPFHIRLEEALPNIEKAAELWRLAGNKERAAAANNLAADGRVWLKEQDS